MAVFITVLILLGALLVLDNTVFGLYTFTIYFYVIRFLAGPGGCSARPRWACWPVPRRLTG